jgi:hypothetical protein
VARPSAPAVRRLGGAAADVIDHLVRQFHDVEVIDDDVGVRQRLPDGFGVGGGRVDRDVGDPGAELRCLGFDPVDDGGDFRTVDLG